MIKVTATGDRLVIRQRIYVYLIIYYIMVAAVCYGMIRKPDMELGFILAAILLLGWLFGKPLQFTLTYDRKNRRLNRENNWLGPVSTFCDQAEAPDKWVIEIEYCTGEGPQVEAVILLDYGYRFVLSHRSQDAEILASYVSYWEDIEIYYYESRLFRARKQTNHRMYSKDKRGQDADFSDLNGVYF